MLVRLWALAALWVLAALWMLARLWVLAALLALVRLWVLGTLFSPAIHWIPAAIRVASIPAIMMGDLFISQCIISAKNFRYKSLPAQVIAGANHCWGREFRRKSLSGQVIAGAENFGASHCLHKYIQKHSGGQQPNPGNCRISFRAQRTFIFDIQMFCNCLANRGNSYICNPRHIV